MRKEIGGNFCEEIKTTNYPIKDSTHIRFFDTGRSAIRYLLKSIGIKKALLPQFTCESIITPFLEKGVFTEFYSIDNKFEIEVESFLKCIEKFQPDLILVHAYFGFDTLLHTRNLLMELRRKGIIIVEDITQCIFMKNLNYADYYVGSLRKWCEIPDGGFLASSFYDIISMIHLPNSFGENLEFLSKRKLAQKKKREYFSKDLPDFDEEKLNFIKLYEESECLLDTQKECFSMSDYSRDRINALDWDTIKHKRQENFRYLRDNIYKSIYLNEIKLYSQTEDIPLYFPVLVDENKRDNLRIWMRHKNIMLPIIWPKSEYLNEKVNESVTQIYQRIIAIPCDQRYSIDDMNTIIEKIIEWESDYRNE